jgi:transposase
MEDLSMMGRQVVGAQLFYDFCIDDHVPSDHSLRQLDAVLNFDHVRSALANYYSHTGRPSIDPELMLRMLLIGYAYGIRSERRLVEEVHLNLAYRWFCRLGLDGAVPDHSTFSKNRYGRFRESEVYRILFEEVVRQCQSAGLISGEGFAVDGSLITADANRDRRVNSAAELQATSQPVRAYLAALDAGSEAIAPREGEAKHLSATDPEAAWNIKEGRGKFGYFTNYLIDNRHAVIVDVEATPARLSQEIVAAKAMLDRVEATHGVTPSRLAADKAYGTGPFLAWLMGRKVAPHIPVLDRQNQVEGILPREAFSYDPKSDTFTCPEGAVLKKRGADRRGQAYIYRSRAKDCRLCPQKTTCTRGEVRTLTRSFHEDAREKVRSLQDTEIFQQSRRERKKVEMLFAHLKQHMKLHRLRLRGLAGAAEEFLLAATVQNLRKLIRLRPPDLIPKRLPIAA